MYGLCVWRLLNKWMPSITQGVLVKVEVEAEAMETRAKIDTDPNQKADHQASAQIVVQVTL